MEIAAHPAEAIAAGLAAAQALAGVDWAEVDRAELPQSVLQLEQMQTLLDAAKVAAVARVQATDALSGSGWASSKDFLTAVSGGHKGSGPALVRLAERLEGLPATKAAMAAGWLSRAKATVITTKIATLPHHAELRAAAEALLLQGAASLDATDLDRSWPAVIKEIDPDGKLLGSELSKDRLERAAHRARHLSFAPDGYGGVRIRGYGSLEEAELVKESLMSLAAPVTSEPGSCGGKKSTLAERAASGELRSGCPDPTCAHDGRDPRDHGARMWDALVEACRRLQTADLLPDSHSAPVRLMVTTSLDELTKGLDDKGLLAGGTLPGGDAVSVEAVRRMACDAQVIPAVMGSAGQPLDVGRTARLVTLAIWYALVLRDKHCAFPGCTRPPIACDAHHVVHWVDGGETSLANLVLLCRAHHTLTHQSPWRVWINPHTGRPEWIPPPATGVRLTIRRGRDPGTLVA